MAARHLNGSRRGRNGLAVQKTIDHLGRVVIPVDLRHMLGLETGDEIAIQYVDGNIVISKANTSCVACGRRQHLVVFRHMQLCRECIAELVTNNA